MFATFDISALTSPLAWLANMIQFPNVTEGNTNYGLRIQIITDLLHNNNEEITAFAKGRRIIGMLAEEAIQTAHQ